MDGLVTKKFDLKYRQILREENDALHRIQGDFSSRGMINSGVYLKHVFETALMQYQNKGFGAVSARQLPWLPAVLIAEATS